ncbi:Sortilin-related receptor [Aphelenchoides fujianensis]|nr:Sortilin-related receptor [Aphelenchoides fujianensis]
MLEWKVHSERMERGKCPSLHFECDAKCIPEAWRCDNHRDCANGEDEASCDQAAPPVHFPPLRPIFTENKAAVKCEPDKFRCRRFAACIPARFRCNGMRDCRDGSDEEDCEATDFSTKRSGGQQRGEEDAHSNVANREWKAHNEHCPGSIVVFPRIPSAVGLSISFTHQRTSEKPDLILRFFFDRPVRILARPVSRPIASTGGHRAPVNVVMRDAIRPTEINVSPHNRAIRTPPLRPPDQRQAGRKKSLGWSRNRRRPAKRFILPMDHFPAIVPVL